MCCDVGGFTLGWIFVTVVSSWMHVSMFFVLFCTWHSFAWVLGSFATVVLDTRFLFVCVRVLCVRFTYWFGMLGNCKFWIRAFSLICGRCKICIGHSMMSFLTGRRWRGMGLLELWDRRIGSL